MEEERPLLPSSSSERNEPLRTKSNVLGLILAGVLIVSAGLNLAGMSLEAFFTIEVEPLELPHPTSSKSLKHANLKATVTTSGLLVVEPDRSGFMKYPFTAGERRLDDRFFERFNEYIVSMGYTSKAWIGVRWFVFMSTAMQLCGAALQLVFRTSPTTLSFKAGSTFNESWKNALPVWLTLFSCFFGLTGLILANSSVQSTATRLALHAIREKSDEITWQEFLNGLDGPQPRLYLMNTLKTLGHWFVKDGGCRWSVSTYLIMVPFILTLAAFIAVFYMDTRAVRQELHIDEDCGVSVRVKSELKRLPRHCRVLPLWLSVSLFIFANVLTKLVGRYINNNGRWLNRLPWVAGKAPPQDRIVADVVNDHTRYFWLQPSQIIDAAPMIWMPLVSVITIGSIHRTGLLSKMLEVMSYIFILRAISNSVTLLPSAMVLVQRPSCYEDDTMSWGRMWLTGNYCNDMIFSGHSSVAIVAACVLMFMLIYGPYRSKAITISLIMLFVVFSLSLVLLGRYHYSADIILAFVVCFLVALIHSPAWKIFFYFRRFELDIGSVDGLERVCGELESISMTVEVVSKSNKIDYEKSEWQIMDQKIEKIRQYLELLYTS
jgi:hypothetical protein